MDKGHSKLVLCSGNNLYPFYKMAMAVLNLLERTLLVSAEMVEKATLVGQMTIAQNQALT